ncbi:non-ribosomal peptide synthetase [Actinomadura sp. NEAU-AAG7]|uniref:non-ribosomal peptide synthetase n=1 Tax=Actinomadura sp. NEAU-AAG7 TaxID=2839640 RepID=UPI001BE49176|nr:non-ribosomal peptide synthetase [Actinomadura sp. NEAU-AAG7]MBT2210888.1 amino acid adenylation domain-containing protein [Actinomadura sp. NEAU-AAG7]
MSSPEHPGPSPVGLARPEHARPEHARPEHARPGSARLGRGAPLPPPPRTPVHELVTAIARAHPARPAVRCGGRTVGYGELDAWSARIAARLAAAGVRRGDHVGLLAEPSAAMVAAALGVLRAGAAYVPVHRENPDRRVAEILADAGASWTVATEGEAERLSGLGLPFLPAEDGDDAAAPPGVEVGEGDPAYLIYTSGSTGEPKGVLVEHGHLAASTLARHAVYPGAPVFLLVSPIAFDSSVVGLWGTLTAGGCLVVATADEVRDPARLVALVEEHGVTRTLCVPSLYRVLLDAAERAGIERLASLDTVIVAGEPLPEPLVRRHFALRPGPIALVNEYGPTEATVWASYHRFDAPGPVSIGGPIPGAALYVLDEELRPVPPGTEGELVIGGAGIARGYFGDPGATARAFVDDPFAEAPGARMYRTGDRVRWNGAGTLDFLGRRDQQVKIRGHRVELGAVEAALRGAPGVGDAVAVPDQAGAQLVGFVVAASDIRPEDVRAHVAERFPGVMVPARVRILDAFPRTLNGKVDRAALLAKAEEAPSGAGAPTGVAAAWAEVLKISEVPAEVNFFDLGGNSLTMFRLQDALELHTGTRPSIVALFRHTTVAAQSALIRDGGAAADGSPGASRQAAARRARAARARRQRTAPADPRTTQETGR